MANEFKTNKKTELVALRAAESAGYLTVGSKSYLKDQLIGKRNGQKYTFVIRDAGKFQLGTDISATGASSLNEREVPLEIVDGVVAIDTNIIEAVTDVEWDKEVAQPQGQKIVNGIVKKTVEADLGKAAVAMVGEGFMPLAKASGYLKSITDENLYGFVDGQIESVLTANGQQFVAVGAPEMYKSGLLGNFHGVEYRSQRFMPLVTVAEQSDVTVTSYAVDNTDSTKATLTLSGTSGTIAKGTPMWIEGVYATDMVGDKTSCLKAFIAIEDSSNGAIKVQAIEFSNEGNKEVCDANGDAIEASDLASKSVKFPTAGDYFTGIVRCDGAMEFDTLNKLDFSNAESKIGNVNGVTVHENRAVDALKGTNVTRWDIASVAGIVDSRAVAYIMVKA